MSSLMRWTISQKLKGITLLSFLRDHVPAYSSVRSLKKAIEKKSCRVNGRIVTFSTQALFPGDEISFHRIEEEAREKITIVYEDDYLIVCNKPSDTVSENETFQKRLGEKYSKALLIHRLDKDTTGLIMLAKDASVKEKMIVLFEEQLIEKEYLAIVSGKTKSHGKIENFLVKKYMRGGQPIFGSSPAGKYACTIWKQLAANSTASLLSCKIITGRTHQLRVHLSEMGHPILGDVQYGKDVKYDFFVPRQMLHALALTFPHPISGQAISLKAPPPKDLEEVQKHLRLSRHE